MTEITQSKKRSHRTYSVAFKAQVVRECRQHGLSVAGVALSHGINPNLVYRWRKEVESGLLGPTLNAFIPLTLTEVGCMAHARRKFMDLHLANKSTIAQTALELMGRLYGVEREVKDANARERRRIRQTQSAPIAQKLHEWLRANRLKIPDGTASAKAIDYSLNRWEAVTRFLDDGALPIDNNHDEQQIRPWATGRKNWLFAGSLMAGQRAAAITSLIQSAKLNGLDPYAYLKDVLTRLPTHRASDPLCQTIDPAL